MLDVLEYQPWEWGDATEHMKPAKSPGGLVDSTGTLSELLQLVSALMEVPPPSPHLPWRAWATGHVPEPTLNGSFLGELRLANAADLGDELIINGLEQ